MLGESNGPALAGIRPAPLCKEYGRKSRRMVASASNLPRWVVGGFGDAGQGYNACYLYRSTFAYRL